MAYSKQQRTENRRILLQKRRQRAAEFLKNYKEERSCFDCGGRFPHYVMDFDHTRDKFKNVSRMTAYKMERILEEIQKCELVCSNCHRIRTFARDSQPVVSAGSL